MIELRELDELRETLGEIPLPGGPNGLLEKIVLTAGVKKQAQQVRLAVTNDVERSRRVLRLLYANWLAQVDKAAEERAPIAIHEPNVIFAADPHAPPAAQVIAPEELKTAIDHTLLAEYFHRPSSWSTDAWSEWYWQDKGMLAREPRRRAVLLVKLAAELYLREHGKPPRMQARSSGPVFKNCHRVSKAATPYLRGSTESRSCGHSYMANSTNDKLTLVSGRLRRGRLTRFRVATAAILSALLVLAGISIWRMWSLGDLPDIGDPFDVEQARQAIKIPDADNAFEAYAKASLIPGDAPPEFWAERSNKDDALRWSTAKPASVAYLEKHRRVLEIWRLGSERSDCLPHQPGELSVATPINFVPESMVHAAMAALEGRLEDAGKMAEAWDWYRAILRSSRLLGRHGVLVERNFGSYSHELAVRRIVHWASDPRVDARMLSRARRSTGGRSIDAAALRDAQARVLDDHARTEGDEGLSVRYTSPRGQRGVARKRHPDVERGQPK